MKVSLNWLRELVDLPEDTGRLVDLLTLAGVEVEDIEQHGVAIVNVVVAEIRESVQHPNADRLSVCQIDDGSGTLRQIVCGAKNYRVGDKVPVALPGAVLPGDFKIKVGKLRGVESQGMLCSAEELGMPKGEDGLLILGNEPAAGTPLGALFPSDTVLELEVTPNRPDLLSVNGIAREIGALTGKPVRFVEPQSAVSGVDAGAGAVQVASLERCPFYSARAIRGVKVVASPEWLRRKLEAVGLRPINNLVDATNLVMLELGQPLHVFDADVLEGAVRVRCAVEGEEMVALDGKSYRLGAEELVIADGARPQAIAGIMGGEASGVTERTVNVLLESAYFEPRGIRRSARKLGLSSDSSYRFERGVDRAGVLRAAQRATELILELAGGEAGPVQVGGNVDALSREACVVGLRAERLCSLLGVKVEPARVEQILTGFGLVREGDGWRVPSFRADLTREIDLVEEVARVFGMEAIPAKTQARFVPASDTDGRYDVAMELRRACVAAGLHEARSITLVPEIPLGLSLTGIGAEALIRVKNPMIDDQVVLRPNLLHGLLKAVGDNFRAQAESVRLFEVGRVFFRGEQEEGSRLAMVLSGALHGRSWRGGQGREADLFDLKGILSGVLGSRVGFESKENSALALSLALTVGGREVGVLGQLWPADARALDAKAPVMFAEVNLDALAQAGWSRGGRVYEAVPRFPGVTRDIAMLVPLGLGHAEVVRVLESVKEPLLVGVELFDVFADASGEKVPADRKSLAYSLTYRSVDRTLTTEEVNAAHGRLKEALAGQLAVSFRE